MGDSATRPKHKAKIALKHMADESVTATRAIAKEY